jgi:NADH dehydrogenase [ubiquinone] 1 alpha subcomplex assembly factor 7
MERLDQFMARANAAYYARHDPYADFTTAPEITQVFGELLGLWAAVIWASMGRPAPVLLAEAGPGRGTLMRDALRAIRQTAPDFAAALQLHLIEGSARLRACQAAQFDATWHERLAGLPPGPLILLANEFLDALPIRQFVRRPDGCAERFVADGRFVEIELGRPPPLTFPLPPQESTSPPLFAGEGVPPPDRRRRGAPEGGEGCVVEICEPARDIVAQLSRRLARHDGAALFLDYGPQQSAPGDSLQAIRDGRAADPLADPGQADLTAHVDFAALAAAARTSGAAVHGPLPQGVFLTRLGLFQRTDRLARGQPPARAAALIAAAQRLAEPMHMGRLFKALAIAHPSLPTPPGFEAAA